MSFNSTIVTDTIAINSVLTVDTGTPIETIEYSNGSYEISSRGIKTISKEDFLKLIVQIDVFQQNIILNFSPNIITPLPFGKVEMTNENNGMTWAYSFLIDNTNNMANYSYNLTTQEIGLNIRAMDATATLQEWLSFLTSLKQFGQGIKNI